MPDDGVIGSNENNNSVVLLLTLGQVSFVLTGDAGAESWPTDLASAACDGEGVPGVSPWWSERAVRPRRIDAVAQPTGLSRHAARPQQSNPFAQPSAPNVVDAIAAAGFESSAPTRSHT
jgi:hypothetical protein